MPAGLKVKQMHVWNDTLFVLTKATLYYAPNLRGLAKKVKLRQHPSFKECKVKKMAFGLDHMLVLSSEGVVFAIGDNQHGQLGISSGLKIVQSPMLCGTLNQISVVQAFIEQGIRIKDIACGEHFSAFVSSTPREAILGAGISFIGD